MVPELKLEIEKIIINVFEDCLAEMAYFLEKGVVSVYEKGV
ncbi:MAG: hypothetical protein AAGA18_10475 [Verrucomicrobiota bacterium]